jgi:hypothetical protein
MHIFFTRFISNSPQKRIKKVSKKKSDLDLTPITPSNLGFRLQGVNFFLTFSQVKDTPLDFFVQTFLTHLNVFGLNVVSHTFTCEFHADGGRHFHCVLGFDKKISTRDSRIFDCLGFHPNISPSKRPKDHLIYILKSFKPDDNPGNDKLISSFLMKDLKPLFGVYAKKEKKKSKEEVSISVFNSIKNNDPVALTDCMGALVASDPIYTLRNYKKIYTSLTYIKVQYMVTADVDYVEFFRFGLEYFPSISRWILQDYKSKVLCLIGPTRIGKSSAAYQIALLLGKHPLIVNELNGLVHLVPGHHTSIIFNDFQFPDLLEHRSALLSLFDSKFSCTIRVLFQSIFIPGNLPKVITSNFDLKSAFLVDDALSARMSYVYACDFFKTNRSSYSLHLPHLIPCSYKNNTLVLGRPSCQSSIPMFSFFHSVKKTILRKAQFDEFVKIFSKHRPLTDYQLNSLKCLNFMFHILKEKYPSTYRSKSIYHAFQFYTILNKPNLDLDLFIRGCYGLYKDYIDLSVSVKEKSYYGDDFSMEEKSSLYDLYTFFNGINCSDYIDFNLYH